MPEHHDVRVMHEQYKSPQIAVGELVAFKSQKKDIWDFGWVSFANAKTWKPGDPAGTYVNVRRCPRNFGEPLIIENCVHVKDPLYEYDTSGTFSCWEKVGLGASSLSDLASMYNELCAELHKAKIAEGELVKLKAELEQTKILAQNAINDVAKFSSMMSQMNMAKQKKEAA